MHDVGVGLVRRVTENLERREKEGAVSELVLNVNRIDEEFAAFAL